MTPFSTRFPVGRRVRHGIVPPHLLDAIVRHGSAHHRACAAGTLRADQTFRALRALPGPPLRRAPRTQGLVARRQVHDAAQHEALPGRLARREGDPPVGDVAVDEAYESLGTVVRFWSEVFGRDSIDGEGGVLRASVHFGHDYLNAFWNGRQMVFGDGDGELFAGFTAAIDVVGHELAHGVTQDECGLAYFGEPGALNESLSDVFGSLVRQFSLGQQAREADWLVGAGVFGPSVAGRALRSLAAPGTAYDDPRLGRDPQPAHMRAYVHTIDDHGGVHVNSGIPNHAFYRTAMALGGHAWERAGRIWYAAMRDPVLAPDSSFERFAAIVCANARRFYGADSAEARATLEGWRAVGVSPQVPLGRAVETASVG